MLKAEAVDTAVAAAADPSIATKAAMALAKAGGRTAAAAETAAKNGQECSS